MRNYCVGRLGTEDTNDAMAEIFTVVWRRVDELPADDEIRLWLYGVARNVVRNLRRTRRRSDRLVARLSSVREEPLPGPEVQVIRRSEDREILAALATLKQVDQELLRLKAWEELPHAEIGQVLGISAHAVDMRLYRALKKMAKVLSSPSSSLAERTRPRPMQEGGAQ
jgi:RNA polymerase sigma-70 factor (ECF subfamily)